ncbi:DUF4129 domain-containing protein [Deinococcus metallilatus]|uniref:Protein-glutamine gamma-glutamyltransferase-like C-terminal domain-containing protein n=2 Tax=Deinococcus metallilatus TaxID=1211322 RepID=A0ABR6MVJ0_9DEIO|nr:DUF4129 domain-containing protein [Deinococcus metallilatus]MBB5295926.1 hypothetical protein [Deinococcus metallilatus]GMA14539.1 hypothetical protein GCM10025871_08700 [Deinococcus metallilatus]
MPSPAASPTRPRPRWADRSWLLVLVPLAGLAWLPWWSVLGLMLALAITHGEGEARSVRVPLLLLGGGLGLALLLPGMRGPEGALAFTQMFGRVMGGTALVYLASSALDGGRVGWGTVWLGVLLLLGSVLPGEGPPLVLAVGLLALVLALLGAVGAENRPFLRLGGSGRALLGVAGLALVGAVLVGLLAFAWQGRPAPPSLAVPPPVTTRGPGAGTAVRPASPPASVARPRARPAPTPQAAPSLGTDLPLLGGLFLMLALLLLFLRGRAERWRAGVRPRWWELLAAAGLLVAALLGIAFVFAAPGSGMGGGLGGAAGPGGATGPLSELAQDPLSRLGARVLWWLSLISFVVLTVLAGAVVWLALKLHPDPAGEAGEADPAPVPAPTPPEALHRVRLAYRAALTSLAEAGLGRGGSETPAEHAGRAVRELPSLAAPLGTLVAAYAPVRYGGRVTDEDADAAERAARDVAQLTAGVRLKRDEPESETP